MGYYGPVKVQTKSANVRSLNNAKNRMMMSENLCSKSSGLKDNQWFGQSCYIVAGGPSLTNFDFSLLEGNKVIGVNKAFIKYPKCDISYAMDIRFHKWIKDKTLDRWNNDNISTKWDEFKGVKVFLQPIAFYPDFEENIFVVRRRIQPTISTSLEEGILAGQNVSGENSGFGAIVLAMCLGANPIYLLGYDGYCDGEKTHHYGDYPNQDAAKLKPKLERYKVSFESKSEEMERLGFKIINLNPNSNIDCFEKQDAREHFMGKAGRVCFV